MQKKSMLNPVENAKTIAFLFFLFAFLSVLDLINGNVSSLTIVSSLLFLVIGMGLRQQKLWGVYTLGALAAITLLLMISTGDYGMIVSFLIEGGLFYWFYSAKSKFKK